jgi:putative transposase
VKEYQSLSHTRCDWDCKYHIVFIPKRRKKAIFGSLRRQLGKVFRELARHKEAEVVEGHLMPDHVHMCVSIPPKVAVSNVVRYIKGKSAIAIARKFMGRESNCILSAGLFRVHGGIRRADGSSVHPRSRRRRTNATTR